MIHLVEKGGVHSLLYVRLSVIGPRSAWQSRKGNPVFGHYDYRWSELSNISANHGCWGNLLGVLVDKARRGVGGFQVGCYSVAHYDGDTSRLRAREYFAMCNHGSKSGGADTRRGAIYLAKQSMTYCDECAVLAQKKQN